MMQFGNLRIDQAFTAGQSEDSIEDEYISKMLLRWEGTAGTDGPNMAELKAAWINARLIKGGKETILYDMSLWDLLALTDFNGGFACGFSTSARMQYGNIVMPFGLDLTAGGGGGHLEFRFLRPTTVADTTFSMFSMNDGSRPGTLRYRTMTTLGTAAYESVYKLYSRDETDASSNIKIGTDKIKPIYHKMGRIALQEWAAVESASLFGQLVSQDTPGPVLVYPTNTLTLISVESIG